MKIPLLKIITLVVGAFVVSAAIVGTLLWFTQRGPSLGGDFTLKSPAGGDWHFSDAPKDLNLLYIGYTKCPDVCPMTLSLVSQAFTQLSPRERSQVRFIFVTVDYDHDTPQTARDYAAQFSSEFTGLSGSKEQINALMKLVGASYIFEKDPKTYLGYSIAHTDRVFFLNKKGIVVESEANVRSTDSILKKIKDQL